MSYREQLETIFGKTSGKCHICHGRLAFRNYGLAGNRGAWNIEHSVPRANGGTDHGNNLYAAHITCNTEKGTRSTRAARRTYGKRRRPMSAEQRERKQAWTMGAGATAGAAIGGLVGGPLGAGLGMLLGTAFGASVQHPDE